MKKKNYQLAGKFSCIIRMGIISSLILFLQAFGSPATAQPGHLPDPRVRSYQTYIKSDTVTRWTDWNILMRANATSSDINRELTNLKNELEKFIAGFNASHPGPPFKVIYHVVHCPCDPLLFNLNTTPIGASGSTTPPPPPPPPHGASGDLVSVNNPTEPDSVSNEKEIFLADPVKFHNPGIDGSKTLAVMDTGLDSLRFARHFRGLLWTDPKAKQTLRNFQFYHNGKALNYMQDDDAHLHGTAVTTVALTEFEKASENNKPLPRVMVLKVLDEHGQGSSFSVSCALSYVAQKKATLVNASLGYYSKGVVDSILLHYVDQCTKKESIPMLAAAGNTPGIHNPSAYCGLRDKARELTDRITFDPASYSFTNSNVISVTTLNSPTEPCHFQNFSKEYVDVGVVNNRSTSCCQFFVSFLNIGYEGSSFATPFVSGNIMACLTKSGATLASCQIQWSTISAGAFPVTKGGKFINNP